MKDITIINHIEIDGKEYLWDDLPEERRRELSVILQDRMMMAIGFRRKQPA